MMLAQRIVKNVQGCPIRSAILARIRPQLFDVSLRDGLQNADPAKWTTNAKLEVFRDILSKETPRFMEIGSLVSPKILPIMKDSLEIHSYANTYVRMHHESHDPRLYMLVPSLSKLQTAILHGVRNVSFITSVSNSFQKRNTNRTLNETKTELKEMEKFVKTYPYLRTKLYVSCIAECPIAGKQDPDYILRELLAYHYSYDFDELCMSDTCGTLTFDDYEYLVDTLIHFGVPPSKLSLHLHVSETNKDEIRKILWHSFQKKICKFDVSMVETGGCSVTMHPDQRLPNLSYDLFYHFLERYIECYADIYH
jgi:isopropylmalate/homocitrate/citramalate synthase